VPFKLDEAKLSESSFMTSSRHWRHEHHAEIFNNELPDYHEIDGLSDNLTYPSGEMEAAATTQSADPLFAGRSLGYIAENSRLHAITSSSPSSPNKLKIRYIGSRKGLLAFHTKSHCNCTLCNDWTSSQHIPLKNDKGTYGVMPFKGRSDDRDVDICPNQL